MSKNKHTFYNYQFKHTVVTIANHPNIQGRSVAEALDIHPVMIYRWKKHMRDGDLVDNKDEARSKSELERAKEQIRSLQKENARLREENIILKKAERLFPGKK